MGDEKILAMRKVTVFDFDGTLTKKDTLLEFIKYASGARRFYIGFMLYSPILILMKLHLYPNWKVKQMIFSYFFKGMYYEKFKGLGCQFADRIELFKRADIVEKLHHHLSQGDSVYVISASIEEWVKPWCKRKGVYSVLCTNIEVDDGGCITGVFLTPNCYGKEKVNRFLECEPHREEYYLSAYGDSRGDKEMLEFADKSVKV